MKTLMIMAGGTGGHIYPALAVAEQWQSAGHSVVWLGTQHGLEARLVPEAGIEVEWISIYGLRGKGITGLLLAPWRLLKAVVQSLRAIRRQRPDVVLGMGGFVAGPGGVAAWLLRIPLLIHEQNAVAGLTNRLLAPLAQQILEAFPGAFSDQSKVSTIGNPLRTSLTTVDAAVSHAPLRLLILGGSLGAQRLNQLVPELFSLLRQQEMQIEIYHQAGGNNLEETQRYYHQYGVDLSDEKGVRLVPYIEEMAEAYRWADLVLCRSGAMTVSELTVVGRGAILVPFPHAVDDHQTANGMFLVNNGAALMLQQQDLDGERLFHQLVGLINDPEEVARMGAQARALAQPDAAQQVVKRCQVLCQSTGDSS